MVDFDCDAYGSPILVVSDLAVHTKVYTKISRLLIFYNSSQYLNEYVEVQE